ncbi:MAG: hypothetical protein KAR07_04630 [Spirochaetes bacterium]|nr:hypothetical protein [Spirochaetota bacterium]
MKNSKKALTLIFLFLFVSGTLFASRALVKKLETYCGSKIILQRIKKLINWAQRSGFIKQRFYDRIREGMLRNASCRIILRVLQKEYQIQIQAKSLLHGTDCDCRDIRVLIINFLYLKLKPGMLHILVKNYRKNKSRIFLARAGYFLLYMKKAGWKEFEVLPLAVIIIKNDIDKGRIESIKRLLLHSRDIKIKRRKAVSIVLKGIKSNKSHRRIMNVLNESRLF